MLSGQVVPEAKSVAGREVPGGESLWPGRKCRESEIRGQQRKCPVKIVRRIKAGLCTSKPVLYFSRGVCSRTTRPMVEGRWGGRLASVVVRNSTLAGNVANEGAGIHVSHGNVTLAQRALVIQNSAQRVGGGLFCLDCAVVIEGGSDVAQNVVAYSQYTYGSGNGGGVYLTAASRDKGQSVCLTLDGAAITGNVAWDGGGAVYAEYCAVSIQNGASVTANRARSGGGIYGYYASSISIHNGSHVDGNSADGGSGGGGLLAGPVNQNAAGNRHPAGTLVVVERSSVGHNSVEGAADGGGCILTGSNCTVVLDQAMLVNCSSQGDGGGVHLGPESTLVASNRTQILSCITEGHGGGMYGSDGSELLLHQETLVHANRGDQAGGIYVLGSLVMKAAAPPSAAWLRLPRTCDMRMPQLPAAGAADPSRGSLQGGGCVTCCSNPLKKGGSRVSGNRATSGGGLFAGPSARVTVEEGSSVEHNSAMGTGGGVYTASHTQLLVQNSAVTNNMAGNFGGAIAVMGENASAILHSVIMRSNIAQGEGGGLYATDPSYATTGVSIARVSIQGGSEVFRNRAESYSGGGLAVLQGVRLRVEVGLLLLLACAQWGCYSCSHVRSGLLRLLIGAGSVVAENVAAIHGGGVYAYDAEVTVLDSTLANNTAQAEGGHGYIVRGSRMDMAGCVLKGGVANWGGALSVRTDSVAVVDATSLEGNSAAVGGGGVVVSHNSHLVLNTSWVTQHTAEHRAGGAVYLYNATVSMLGTYLWGNTAMLAEGWRLTPRPS
ncbi:hypothetical protein CYMTET_23850 [Cymbomonas tetramitiformis]|uniref:Right handed beta helix domain-containing protein n=1 Tax=Cymbomonas tetramitiformis TaxID=36881 RepID=A0AAE0FYG9_9CHLO|nr:hypothetical protein CYMTET_23850 [Cymbomonas tetramitiformis]